MQQMLMRLLQQLRLQTLTPDGDRAVARFTDIVIQDGSSFAIKTALADAFPGRFTTIEPAAVEVHATYSGFADEVSQVERTFGPLRGIVPKTVERFFGCGLPEGGFARV